MKTGFKIIAKAAFKPALWDVGVRANTLFRSVEAAQAKADQAALRDGEYQIHSVVVTSARIR